MKQVKSVQEFDIIIAIHKVTGRFVKLDYGLISPQAIRMGKDENSGPIRITENKSFLNGANWRNPDCVSMKASIGVGTIIVSS